MFTRARRTPKTIFAGQRGLTLIELATVLFIFGIALAATIGFVLPIYKSARLIETQTKLERIAKAIDYYAIKNNRLPCPAAPDEGTNNPPFGFERGSGTTGNQVPENCGNNADNWTGIVPFRTLGIPRDWITDAAGKPITYAISPAFAHNPYNDALQVHARCRTVEWMTPVIIYSDETLPPVFRPKNAPKARFCCPAANIGDDLVILDAAHERQLQYERQADLDSYGAVNAPYNTSSDPLLANTFIANDLPKPDDQVVAPTYILVSHGSHGGGAWNINTGARFPLDDATPAETENADDDRTFYELIPVERAGAEQDYDDVTLWRTQYLMFSSHGESCALP